MFKNLLSALPSRRKPTNRQTQPKSPSTSAVLSNPQSRSKRPRLLAQAAILANESEPADTDFLGGLAEDAVDSLSGQFEAWMRGDLDELVRTWHLAREPGATAEQYRAVFTAAHNIKGAANSYGYPAIARLCGSLSRLLSDTRPGENSALINLHVEACRAAFNSIGQGSDAQSIADAVCEALEERVALKVAHS
jgi:HPt (histidine-containing phosphotransfer) domain-containing protein